MNKTVYGINLLNQVTRGSIFFSADEEILKVRKKILRDFAKSYPKGSDGNRYKQMKRIFKKYALIYFKEVHYEKMFYNTQYAGNEQLAEQYRLFVEQAMGRSFENDKTLDYIMNKSTVDNLDKLFNEQMKPVMDAFVGKLEKSLEIANHDGTKASIATLKEVISFLQKRDDITNWLDAKAIYKEKYIPWAKEMKAKRLLSIGELEKIIRQRSKWTQMLKGCDKILNSIPKIAGMLGKAVNIYKGFDFAKSAYNLSQTEYEDNVQYFKDVKQVFNKEMDFLCSVFGDVPGMGSMLNFYNKAFKSMDVAVDICANHARKLEKASNEAQSSFMNDVINEKNSVYNLRNKELMKLKCK